MSVSPIQKAHINGYELICVDSGAWIVHTEGDRLASFATREEAAAYAINLPTRRHEAPKQRSA